MNTQLWDFCGNDSILISKHNKMKQRNYSKIYKYEFFTISQSVQIWQVAKIVRTNQAGCLFCTYKIGKLPNLYAYKYEFSNNFTKRTNQAGCLFCTYKIGKLPNLYAYNYEFLTILQSVQIWQVAKFVRTN